MNIQFVVNIKYINKFQPDYLKICGAFVWIFCQVQFEIIM